MSDIPTLVNSLFGFYITQTHSFDSLCCEPKTRLNMQASSSASLYRSSDIDGCIEDASLTMLFYCCDVGMCLISAKQLRSAADTNASFFTRYIGHKPKYLT